VTLSERRTLYDALAYYEARADAALTANNPKAHAVWALLYHRLRDRLDAA